MPNKKVVSWAKPSTVCATCAGFYLLPLLIQDDYDMMHVSPIDASVPQRSLPSMQNGSWRSVALYTSARSTTRLTALNPRRVAKEGRSVHNGHAVGSQ